MSKIVVDLEDPSQETPESSAGQSVLSEYQHRESGGKFRKIFGIAAGIIAIIVLAVLAGGFIYWQYLKTTPQYSLALLVDASRREDQEMIDQLVDTDSAVDNFVPQITDKAIELYGRGLAPSVIKQISRIATPFLPVVKQRAKAELPGLLKEKTKKFEKIPFPALVLGAKRYLKFVQEGNTVTVSSIDPDRPVNLTMEYKDGKWKVVGFTDEKLARRIAEKIGQEMIALAKNKGKNTIDDLGKQIGIPNLGDIIKIP
ncbi:MAG: hypothetical protein KDB79_09860 [Acidobacteria bacterium]|nr:hypothetical protein [Acidobacteriota bacterium]